MAEFKMTKFHTSDFSATKIRQETLPSGKRIAFAIALTDLSTIQFREGFFDFDKESEAIIKEHENSDTNHAFEYFPSSGFNEVSIDEQKWFVFQASS